MSADPRRDASRQNGVALGCHVGEQRVHVGPVDGVELIDEAADEVERQRRGEEADGRGHARRTARSAGECRIFATRNRGRVQLAEGEQRQPARVLAAFDGVYPGGATNALVDELMDPPRRAGRLLPSGSAICV